MWINFLVCTLLGYLSGLGVGGGSLLMLWLTQWQSLPYPTARTTNLLFFLPSSLIASCCNLKNHRLSLSRALPGIAAGCVAALLFSLWGQNLDSSLLGKIFGGLLLIIGMHELLYRPRKAR